MLRHTLRATESTTHNLIPVYWCRTRRLTTLTDNLPREVYVRFDLQLLLAVASLMAFCLAVFLSAEHSVSRLVNTHG